MSNTLTNPYCCCHTCLHDCGQDIFSKCSEWKLSDRFIKVEWSWEDILAVEREVKDA